MSHMLTYERDLKGNTTKVTNPDGSFKLMAYDAKNNLIKQIDEENNGFINVYDANGINIVKKAIYKKNVTTLATLALTLANVGDFKITEFTYFTESERIANGYKAKGLLKSQKDPLGQVTSYTYTTDGLVKTVTDAKNLTTAYTYNNLGLKQTEITPTCTKTEYSYDKAGRLLRTILNDGTGDATHPITTNSTARVTYDVEGRKTQEVGPNQYLGVKDGLTLTTPNNTYTDTTVGKRYTYYTNGLLKTAKDEMNNITSYFYDIYGNLIREVRPNLSENIYEYDVMNRLAKKSFKDATTSVANQLETYSYQVVPSAVSGIYNTIVTKTVYPSATDLTITEVTNTINDFAGRTIEQQNPQNPDGTIASIKAEYYKNGQKMSVTDANGNKTYFYYNKLDATGNLYDETYSPIEDVSGVTYYNYARTTYNANGLKIEEKVGKTTVALNGLPTTFITTTYTYYADNKVNTVQTSAGSSKTYQYDNNGNVSQEDTKRLDTVIDTVVYENNYLGKVSKKRVKVRAGDISPNAFTDNTVIELATTYGYTVAGQLKTETRPDGVVVTYGYDNAGNKTSESMPGFSETGTPSAISKSYTYNFEAKVLTEVDPLARTTRYAYDQRGNLVKATNAKAGVSIFAYDNAGRKIAEVSPLNYSTSPAITAMSRIVYTYDKNGRILTKGYIGNEKKYTTATSIWTDVAVNIVTEAYEYDSNGNILKKYDALGYEAPTKYFTAFTYNRANKVVSILDPVSKEKGLAYTTMYNYDALGLKTSETAAVGTVTSYTYDDAGNVLTIKARTTANGADTVLNTKTYDYRGNVLTDKDGRNYVNTYQYNALGKVKTNIFPDSLNTINVQYNNLGLSTWKQSTMGTSTVTTDDVIDVITYDNQGRVSSQSNRKFDGTNSITTSAKYDLNGNKRFETNGNGNVVENTYDELNRKISTKITVSGAVQTTTCGYDVNSNLLTNTDFRGNIQRNYYDQLNRVYDKRNPLNYTIQKIEYNHNSAQVNSYDALNNVVKFTYDKNNRLLSTVDQENKTTSQTYDNNGNIATKTDGNGKVTTYTYDYLKRLSNVKNALGQYTYFTYDLNNNMLTQKDGKGNITTFTYNPLNKPLTKVDHAGAGIAAKTETYTYNPDGTMKTKVDRNGVTTTYIYDVHGRTTSQVTGDLTINYTYDNNSNQLTIVDNTGTTTRTYDELNRVLTKTVPGIGTTTYEYDITTAMLAGEKAERSTDPKNNITTKIFDKVGRLKSVSDGTNTSTYTYLGNGNRQSVVYQGGSREDYTYFKNNLVKTLVNKKVIGTTTTTLETFTYTYDAANNMLTKVDKKGTTSYLYDVLNRLSKVTEPTAKVTSYTFDAAGNRLTETAVAGTTTTAMTYLYNEQNRLMGVTTKVNNIITQTIAYSFDNNGNQLITTSTAYTNGVAGTPTVKTTNTYDKLNQLIATTSGATTVGNIYNGEGYRVQKTVNGTVTKYLYEADKIVLETDLAGNQMGRNVYGINLLSRTADGKNMMYMYNGHADVTALINTSTGAIEATYYYDAFGNILEQTGTANNSINYAGYQWDKETGLYYLNSRMYDPMTARFLQEDTYRGDVNDPLSLNLYSYCHNEPIMYLDPNGHEERNLRELVEGSGGSIGWDSKKGVATVTIGDTTKTYDIKKSGTQVKDGHIVLDTSVFIKDYKIKNIAYLYYQPGEDEKNKKYLTHMIRDKYKSETLVLSNKLEGKGKFVKDWNNMDDKSLGKISETTIFTHGSSDNIMVSNNEMMETHKLLSEPEKQQRQDGREWASDFDALNEKYISNLTLASCLSGQLDWQSNDNSGKFSTNYNNVSLEFLRQMNKNSVHVNKVTAWDSEVALKRPSHDWNWLYNITPPKFIAQKLNDEDHYLHYNRPVTSFGTPDRKPIGEVNYIANKDGSITVKDANDIVLKKLDANNNVIYQNYKFALK